ncbi:hypothetical protein [Chitinophaga ginsengisoli]|nr:hypothetical protein [Chitinophaga ginsengisoli]
MKIPCKCSSSGANIGRFYKAEAMTGELFEIFAILAIFISCLGLYGLVSFMAVTYQYPAPPSVGLFYVQCCSLSVIGWKYKDQISKEIPSFFSWK